MWYSLCNLLSRVWNNLISALGTTTLSICLFSFIIPIFIFIITLVFNYREHRKEGIEIAQLIKNSLLSWQTIIPSLIYIIAWISLFVWGLTSTIYNDHKSLIDRINQLSKQIESNERIILDKDIEIKSLEEKLTNIKFVDDDHDKKAQKKKQIMDKLATFLSSATVLQNQCVGVGPPLPPGKKAYQVYEDFQKELYDYINKEIGYSYAQQMVDSLSIPVPRPDGLSEINTNTWMLTEQTKIRIRELLGKFE